MKNSNSVISRLESTPWKDIDDEIQPLVKSVNLYCRSYMSCQGHIGSWPFPYVSILTDEEIGDLRTEVQEYNETSEIKWDFVRSRGHPDRDNGITYLEPAAATRQISEKQRYIQLELIDPFELNYPSGRSLHDYQEDSQELAEFLENQANHQEVLNEFP